MTRDVHQQFILGAANRTGLVDRNPVFITTFLRWRAMKSVVAVLAVLLFTSGGRLEAQQPQGSVRGSVEDVSGAVVAGAIVALVDQTGQTVAEIVTDGSGAFVFDNLRSGAYQVRTEFPGFDSLVRSISVTAGRRTVAPKLVLQVAAIAQEVTVGSDSSVMSTAADGNRNAVVMDAQSLRDIPVFDRDLVGTMSRFLDAGSIGAGGPTLVVDGMEARKVGVSPAAIVEIKINQDPYGAEFQRPGRGRIEVVTKAGSDAYHGSFDFTFRDAAMNARDVFAPTKPPEQRRIYEGVFGGPVMDGKHTSFLFTLEKRDEDLQSIVYAADARGLSTPSLSGRPWHRAVRPLDAPAGKAADLQSDSRAKRRPAQPGCWRHNTARSRTTTTSEKKTGRRRAPMRC